ncbi:MAG: hypothetical protein H6704_22750 [Myxococcales bacterium]|nr:hypothetical protein [Myxococcales bacterium]
MAITPTPDTQPLDIATQLVEAQQTMLREVHDLVAGMLDDAKKQPSGRPAAKAGPWARVVPNRTHRVVLLDGARGTGKTSLMLTLIRAWQGEDPSDHALVSDLAAQGQALRILEPLDFDPKPRDLPLYAWLVQAFEPIVGWIEDAHRVDTEGLRQAWTTLFESAVLSDVIGLDGRTLGDDLEMVVYQQTRGQKGWQALRRHWQRFLDQLLGVLEQVDGLPTNGMLVLPIDDLDMQPGQAKELLLALRLAWHPRLMLLLNGDSAHLTEVLTVELYGEEASVGRMPGVEEQKVRLAQTRRLADAVIGKTIAHAHRLKAPLAGLVDACRVLATGAVRGQSTGGDGGLDGQLEALGAELRSFFTWSPPLSLARWSLLRTSLIDFWAPAEAASPAWEGANTWAWRELVSCGAPKLHARLFEVIQIARDSRGERIWPSPSSYRERPLTLRPVPEWSGGAHGLATSHGNIETRLIDVVEDVGFVIVGEEDVVRPASPIEVVALALLDGQNITVEHSYVPSVSLLIRSDDYRIEVPLPTLPFTSAEHWARTLRAAKAYCLGGLADYVWALMAGETPDHQGTRLLDSNSAPELAWDAIREQLLWRIHPGSEDHNYGPWIWSHDDELLEVIALLTAPEYCATRREQALILETLESVIHADRWNRATQWWAAQRHHRLIRAIEVSLGPNASKAAVEQAKERLVRSLRNGAEDTVWHRDIEPNALSQGEPSVVHNVAFSATEAQEAVRFINIASPTALKTLFNRSVSEVLEAGRPYGSIWQIANANGLGHAYLKKLRDHVAGG